MKRVANRKSEKAPRAGKVFGEAGTREVVGNVFLTRAAATGLPAAKHWNPEKPLPDAGL